MGTVHGKAGVGLADGNNAWAANEDVARIGRGGEHRTEAILNDWVNRPGGPDVLHDVPVPGSRANIDHIVVSGNHIYLIDTKVWAPGNYWAVGGKVFRGLSRFVVAGKDGKPVYPGEKKSMEMASDRVLKYLNARADVKVDFRISTLTVAWPSRAGRVRMVFGRLPGSRLVPGGVFESRLGWFVRRRPANPVLSYALLALTQ